MFVIEDEIHAEQHGRFANFADAMAELRRRAEISWDEAPNAAPCKNWRTCGREYVIVEYDNSQAPWKELGRVPALEISASGVRWARRDTE